MPGGAGTGRVGAGEWVTLAGGELSLCWQVWKTDWGMVEAKNGKAWKAMWMVRPPCVGPQMVLLVGAWPVLLGWAVAELVCPVVLGTVGIWTGSCRGS